MRNAVTVRPTTVELVDQKGLSVLEGLARAARQIALYGPEHPIAARALQDAWRELAAEANAGEAVLEVAEETLLWNGKQARGGSLHLGRLHEGLRERLVACVRFTSRLDVVGLSRLLLILAEDSKLLISSGGVMRAYGPEGPPGILVEDVDFTQELQASASSWVEICEEVDPTAVGPLREILESCLHVVRSASEEQTLAQMRETLAAEPSLDDETTSPVAAIASTIAALIQSAGEIAVHTGSAHRNEWESSILRQLEALGPRWSAHIFRAPVAITPGSPDILSLLTRAMELERCVSLLLDYPGAIVTERSESLSLALRRILADTVRAADLERELHQQALARNISEEVYRNVVGVLMPDLAKLARTDGMWRLLDGGEESLRAEDPQRELADLMETSSTQAVRRSRALMLLDLLEAEMSASQYGSVIKGLLEMAERCARHGESELLLRVLERLQREAGDAGRSSGRRAVAATALGRSATKQVVSAMVREWERGAEERRGRVVGLLGQLGEEGMGVLVTLAKRTHEVGFAEALRALMRHDDPSLSHLRQLLSELPLSDLQATLRALVNTGDPVTLAPLSTLIAHPATEARMALIHAVGEGSGAAGVDIVLRLLTDPEPQIRAAAAEALGKLRAADAVSALCDALGRESGFGPGAWVKAAAARALGEIGSPKAIPSLSAMLFGGGVLMALTSQEPKVAAAEALGKIGTVEARQVIEDWRRCRRHRVREACRRALREAVGGAPKFSSAGSGPDAG